MQKVILSLCAAAIVTMAAGNVMAEEGAIQDNTLAAMGLSGLNTMSDSEALAVRGSGFNFSLFGIQILDVEGVIAGGGSFASVNNPQGDAGTVDGFLTGGRYAAGGEQYSESGWQTIHTEDVLVNGEIKAFTVTDGFKVFAGGFANGWSL